MRLHTLLHKNCNAYANFIVATKQEILVIFLTDFFDAASGRHNNVILLPAVYRVSGNDFLFQQDSAPAHCTLRRARATVELLRQRQETPDFLASNLWLQPRSQSCGLRDLGYNAVTFQFIHSIDLSLVAQTNP